MVIVGLAGVALVLDVIFDIPIYLGTTIVGAPDPDHPGPMKAITVTTLQLVVKTGIAAVLLWLNIWFLRRRKRGVVEG